MHKYAMLFPGQKFNEKKISSYFTKNKIFQNIFTDASEYAKYDLWKLIHDYPNGKIKRNKYLQLINLVSSVAIYKLWIMKQKIQPTLMIGHSLGEYTALICSESLKLSDAIKLIILRYKFVQEIMLNKKGLMTILIGINQKTIKKILSKYDTEKQVSIACINSSNQIVISGEKHAIEKINTYCKIFQTKKIINLPIDFPYHCSLIKKASQKFSKILDTVRFKKPKYSVISSTSLKLQNSETSIRCSLKKQLYRTVNWHTIIKNVQNNITLFIEVSSENVLTNLNKKNTNKLSMSLNNNINFINTLKLFYKNI